MELHTLISTVTSYAGSEAESTLTAAYQLASAAHEGFFRLNGEPFINHPLAVAGILADWCAPPSVIAVGLLHDVLSPNHSHGLLLDYLQRKLSPAIFHLLEATSSLNSLIRRFEGDFDREA